MAVQRVGDMTLDELKAIIEQTVAERLGRVKAWPKAPASRDLQEIFNSVDRNRWTPPPGAKSTLELLREDRGR